MCVNGDLLCGKTRSYCLFLPNCLHGLLPGPFLLSYSVFVFSFSVIFVSVPCARLGWPSRQLLSARKYTVSYSYLIVFTVGKLQY